MSEKSYILALDQGTTSSRCILFDHKARMRAVAQAEFKQYFPKPGWVEHDPREILSTQLGCVTEVMINAGIEPKSIAAIGITNQRETTVVWDAATGEPVYNAIVWQCRRTADAIETLVEAGHGDLIREKTGLIPDAYFSASKIAWILDNVEGARERAERGELLFGTVDSWLIYNLTDGRVHATDYTNASRTLLFDIHKRCWDEELCALFDIPLSMLPEVRRSSGDFGRTHTPLISGDIPICGVAGDQQAALFGQCCFSKGQAKNTYGTGGFLLMNTGEKFVRSEKGLLNTLAVDGKGEPCYALEGSVFVSGALIQWLRDELGLLESASQSADIARSVEDSGGVYIVPAFTGLGAPYWDSDARGAISGITRGTSRAHIVRAALEAMAYEAYDVLTTMASESCLDLSQIRVDGGACANDFLLQFQADILGAEVIRPVCIETTALGAAYLAGLSCGYWDCPQDLEANWAVESRFSPGIERAEAQALIDGWHDAVKRTLHP